ncbi:MAG: ABC transporter ATP-binding protein/permease [Alistipes senegalensis]|nr:ABC transporter ATP-binding protein/permease [Alistipes senegalensis]
MKNKSSMKWLISALKKETHDIIWLTVLNSMISASAVMFALNMRKVIDSAVSHNKTDFKLYAVILGAIIIFQILVRAVCRRINEKTKSSIENILKKRVYETILTRDYATITGYHTGELQNRMTNDTTVISDGMASILPDITAMLVKIAGAAIILLSLDIRFALVFLTGGLILIFVTYSFRKIMKKLHKQVQSADGEVRSYLQETVENLLVIRCFGGEKKSADIAMNKMKSHQNIRLKRNMFSNLCNIGFGIVMNGGYFFGLIWCGTGILYGKISYGTLTAVLQLVNQIQQPFANITGYLPKYYSMLASAERLMELENLKKDNTKEKIIKENRDKLYENMREIRFEGVSFRYQDGTEVLKNFNHSIDKGSFTAIMGQSGIGKSTLLKLMLAIYDVDNGSVDFVLNDNEQIPITDSVRSMFSYVPQGNFLMSGTIAEAVSFMSDMPLDMEKVKKSCEIACADEFIEHFDNGYNMSLGENGAGLSEGQIQRIAVARAVYSDAPVLLLDESTSALDELTEQRLLNNLRKMTDKTVIIITHRKAVLSICDRIIEFKNTEEL